jgi:hypothetical protein
MQMVKSETGHIGGQWKNILPEAKVRNKNVKNTEQVI